MKSLNEKQLENLATAPSDGICSLYLWAFGTFALVVLIAALVV